MIAQLRGTVLALEDGALTLDVGGVGFLVHVSPRIEAPVGQTVTLHTHFQARENDITLYGFRQPEEKALFGLLLGVSGVGPKAALSLLSTLSVDIVRQAILNKQPEALSRAPGVGRKTAEAIVLHLKDKVARPAEGFAAINADDADVIAALTTLGFSLVESQRALQQLPRETLTIEEKIHRCLTLLGR